MFLPLLNKICEGLRKACSYMTKGLRKAIIKRSELKSKYLKLQTQETF